MSRINGYAAQRRVGLRVTKHRRRPNGYRRVAIEPLEGRAAPGETFMSLVGVAGAWSHLPWFDLPGELEVASEVTAQELLTMAEERNHKAVGRTSAEQRLDSLLPGWFDPRSVPATNSVSQQAVPLGPEPDVLQAVHRQRAAGHANLSPKLLDELLDPLLEGPLAGLASSCKPVAAATSAGGGAAERLLRFRAAASADATAPACPDGAVPPPESAGTGPVSEAASASPRHRSTIRPLRFTSGGVPGGADDPAPAENGASSGFRGMGESGGSGGKGVYDYSTNRPQVSGGATDLFHWVDDREDYTADVSGRFWDEDEPHGDQLAYSAASSDANVVTCNIKSSTGELRLDFRNTGTSVITVTATDKAGQAVSADLYNVYVVKVAGITVEERVLGRITLGSIQSWTPPDDGHLLWGMDDHRWGVDIDPDPAQEHVERVVWWQKSWEHRAEPKYPASQFASVTRGGPSFPYAAGTPDTGVWAIWPAVYFPGRCIATIAAYERYATIAVTGVQWTGHDGYTDGVDNLVPAKADGLDAHEDYRFFAEQNHPDRYRRTDGGWESVTDHQLHNMVDVEVRVNPAIPTGMTGTLDLRVYDPDNAIDDGPTNSPNDGDPDSLESDGMHEPNDNHGATPGMTPPRVEITLNARQTAVEETFTIPTRSRQPGNNYFAAASSNMPEGHEYYHFRDDGQTLYYNQQLDGSGGSGGGSVQSDLPAHLQTAELTIWRTLWMELDDMEAPNPEPSPRGDGPFGYGNGDDDVEADPGQPPIGLVTTSLATACVRVLELPVAYDRTDNADFIHNISHRRIADQLSKAVRNVNSNVDFWVVHTIGAYEEHRDRDWDPDGEPNSWLGWAYRYGADGSNFVFYETIRDRQANDLDSKRDPVELATLTERVVLHEALHRFLGHHGGDRKTGVAEGIMLYDTAVYGSARANHLTPRQMRLIQEKGRPN